VPKGKRTYEPCILSWPRGSTCPVPCSKRLLVSRFPQDTALAKIVSSHLGRLRWAVLAAVLFVRLCLFLGLGWAPAWCPSVVLVMGTMVGNLCPGGPGPKWSRP